MKGVHLVDLGQWPQQLVIIADKRAYSRFMVDHCGGRVSDHPPFPPAKGGSCQKLAQGQACVFVIAVGQRSNRDELALLLAHEATHAMCWILDDIGEGVRGYETQAYLVEHIVRAGLKALA